ncbi:hypothetical protein PR048_033568 [Dryococelus australis]|uniref:Uncharacterized protein n=1 Tax=Dryococelus australis TaxID=614101 RepID=A0ABQ9G0N1_9NEOP|nr:hypothetical protein PR048_033568 [Dryococelus australis]
MGEFSGWASRRSREFPQNLDKFVEEGGEHTLLPTPASFMRDSCHATSSWRNSFGPSNAILFPFDRERETSRDGREIKNSLFPGVPTFAVQPTSMRVQRGGKTEGRGYNGSNTRPATPLEAGPLEHASSDAAGSGSSRTRVQRRRWKRVLSNTRPATPLEAGPLEHASSDAAGSRSSRTRVRRRRWKRVLSNTPQIQATPFSLAASAGKQFNAGTLEVGCAQPARSVYLVFSLRYQRLRYGFYGKRERATICLSVCTAASFMIGRSLSYDCCPSLARGRAGCKAASARQNVRAGKTGNPRENPPTGGIVRHDPNTRKCGDDTARNPTRLA